MQELRVCDEERRYLGPQSCSENFRNAPNAVEATNIERDRTGLLPSRGAGVARPFELSRREKFPYGLHDPLALNLVRSFADLKSPRSHRTAEMIGFPLIPILGSCERASNHSSLEKKGAGSTSAFFLAVKRNGCADKAPVCAAIKTPGKFIPGAQIISDFSSDDQSNLVSNMNNAPDKAALTICPKGPYAGCMTSGCKIDKKTGDAECTCPVFCGIFQLVGSNRQCDLGNNLVWSASYTPSLHVQP
jgi:hypothetical protein